MSSRMTMTRTRVTSVVRSGPSAPPVAPPGGGAPRVLRAALEGRYRQLDLRQLDHAVRAAEQRRQLRAPVRRLDTGHHVVDGRWCRRPQDPVPERTEIGAVGLAQPARPGGGEGRP